MSATFFILLSMRRIKTENVIAREGIRERLLFSVFLIQLKETKYFVVHFDIFSQSYKLSVAYQHFSLLIVNCCHLISTYHSFICIVMYICMYTS